MVDLEGLHFDEKSVTLPKLVKQGKQQFPVAHRRVEQPQRAIGRELPDHFGDLSGDEAGEQRRGVGDTALLLLRHEAVTAAGFRGLASLPTSQRCRSPRNRRSCHLITTQRIRLDCCRSGSEQGRSSRPAGKHDPAPIAVPGQEPGSHQERWSSRPARRDRGACRAAPKSMTMPPRGKPVWRGSRHTRTTASGCESASTGMTRRGRDAWPRERSVTVPGLLRTHPEAVRTRGRRLRTAASG